MDLSLINWLDSTFGIDNTVSVPIIVSILVFVVGGIAAAIKSWISEAIQKRRNRSTFENIIREISKGSKTKSRRIKEFYPTLEMAHDHDWSIKISSINYLSIAFDQDYTTVHHSYRVKHVYSCKTDFKIKCFNKIWSILENIKFSEERIIVEFDNFSKKFNQHELGYTEFLEKLRQQHDLLITQFRGYKFSQEEANLLEYLKARDVIWANWQQMDNRLALFNSHDHLVTPLRELNKNYQDIIYSTQQNDLLLPAANEYGQMLKTLSVYQSIFKNYHYNYLNSHKALKYCLENI